LSSRVGIIPQAVQTSGVVGEILLTQIKINQLLYQYDIVIKVVARTHPTLTVAGW